MRVGPDLDTKGMWAYWTDGADTADMHPDATVNSLRTAGCRGMYYFGVIWSLPTIGSAEFLAALEWEERVVLREGASDLMYEIREPDLRPDLPELVGSVTLDGTDTFLTVQIRGLFQTDTGPEWGDWSPRTLHHCTPAS